MEAREQISIILLIASLVSFGCLLTYKLVQQHEQFVQNKIHIERCKDFQKKSEEWNQNFTTTIGYAYAQVEPPMK
jgi:hypothetical protein